MPDLVACPRCERKNAIRRTTCLYCGEALPVTDESSAAQVPTLRPVEEWELGFSVVLAPLDDYDPTEGQVARLCEIARMEEDDARRALWSRTWLPVVRTPSRAEADLVARLLGATDLGATVVSDEELGLQTLARRVRALTFEGDELIGDVLWGGRVSVPRREVVCAVEGRIVSTTVEVLESTGKARGGQRDLVETSEFFAESFLVDVYGPTLETSFRVKADAFDFGCLGGRPDPRVEVNFARLGSALAGVVGRARYDTDFARLARLIGHAWPPAARVESRGIARRGATIKKYSASLLERDALNQFNRYSRLRYVMAPR